MPSLSEIFSHQYPENIINVYMSIFWSWNHMLVISGESRLSFVFSIFMFIESNILMSLYFWITSPETMWYNLDESSNPLTINAFLSWDKSISTMGPRIMNQNYFLYSRLSSGPFSSHAIWVCHPHILSKWWSFPPPLCSLSLKSVSESE